MIDVVERLPKSHQEAARKLTSWPVVNSVAYVNKVVKTPRDGAHPDVVAFYRKFNEELRKRGFPFYAFEFYRSNERQARLLAQGVTRAGPNSSPHNFGCAVDIVHASRYWDLTRLEWAVVGAIGKETARKMKLAVVWGGDWSFWDPAHWELEHWRDLRTARSQLISEGVDLPTDDALRFGILEQRAKANRL